MRMLLVVPSLTAVVLICAALAVASSRAGTRVFYLNTHPHQCLINGKVSPKWVEVVPCSDPAHSMEVYAVAHGGWGHRTPPTATQGWNAFWPDPGSETARYGDKIICSLRHWPGFRALGAGWHVH